MLCSVGGGFGVFTQTPVQVRLLATPSLAWIWSFGTVVLRGCLVTSETAWLDLHLPRSGLGGHYPEVLHITDLSVQSRGSWRRGQRR
jgi:hypothetical protein